MTTESNDTKQDLFTSSMEDRAVRAAFEREWLADEIVVALEQKMREMNVNRSELARRLECSPANVTKLFRRSTNLTLGSLVDVALALNHRFRAPELEPLEAPAPWFECNYKMVAPAKVAFAIKYEGLKTLCNEADLASSSVTWWNHVTEEEAELVPLEVLVATMEYL